MSSTPETPVVETSDKNNFNARYETMCETLRTLTTSVRDLRTLVKSMKTLAGKYERAEEKRQAKRRNKATRQNPQNGGFQKQHNIKGTAIAKFLGTNTASMVEAHRALCKYVKERKDVPVFEADKRVIVMDKKLDAVFPGLMKNYKHAFDVAEKALKIEDKKERRAFLNENINMADDVLTYSGIMKRLPMYFTKENSVESV
jgi:chromatin remodeling complex protein RSC6